MKNLLEKAKDLGKNKKNLLLIGGGVLIVVIAVVVGVVVFASGNNKKSLEKSLMEMGRDFYENFYYDATGKTDKEKVDFVKKFEKIGVKIDLDNLGRYNSSKNKDKVAEFINTSTKKECDKNETRAIIYPKSPYGKKDYEIKVELSCGFDDKK